MQPLRYVNFHGFLRHLSDMDCGLRPELAPFADKIATWSDRHDPPREEREERLGRYPYLGTNYAFQEKASGTAPFLKDIHCFGIGAWMSFGISDASINAMHVAVTKLAAGVTRGLFAAELDHHWDGLRAYKTSQVTLRET